MGKSKIEDEKVFPSTGIEPGSLAWKTSKITITPLETVESYWKYNIHYRLAMSTNSFIWKHVIVETPWFTRDVNPVNHFLLQADSEELGRL